MSNQGLVSPALAAWLSTAPKRVHELLQLPVHDRTHAIAHEFENPRFQEQDLAQCINSNIIRCNATLATAAVRALRPDLALHVFSAMPASGLFVVFEAVFSFARTLEGQYATLSNGIVEVAREFEWGALPSMAKETILRKVWTCQLLGSEERANAATARWDEVSYGFARVNHRIGQLAAIARLWMEHVFLTQRGIEISSVLEAIYVEVSRTPLNAAACRVGTEVMTAYTRARPGGIEVATFVFAARRAGVLFDPAAEDDFGVGHVVLTGAIAPAMCNGREYDGIRIALTHQRIDILCAFLARIHVRTAPFLRYKLLVSQVISHCSEQSDGFSVMAMLLAVACGWISARDVHEALRDGTDEEARILRRNFALFDGVCVADALARLVCARPDMRTLIFSLHLSGALCPDAPTTWASRIAPSILVPPTCTQRQIADRLRHFTLAKRSEKALVCIGLLQRRVPPELTTIVVANMMVPNLATFESGPHILRP